jgi:hypothetical protein
MSVVAIEARAVTIKKCHTNIVVFHDGFDCSDFLSSPAGTMDMEARSRSPVQSRLPIQDSPRGPFMPGASAMINSPPLMGICLPTRF